VRREARSLARVWSDIRADREGGEESGRGCSAAGHREQFLMREKMRSWEVRWDLRTDAEKVGETSDISKTTRGL
jgi:hypothetical protein